MALEKYSAAASLYERYLREFPNRLAVKQAHSQRNPEKDWGRYTLAAVDFAFYVLNSLNQFYRYTTNDPFTGHWEPIPGLSSDLAIGPGNGPGGDGAFSSFLWSIGGPVGANLVSLSVRNEQGATGDGAPDGRGR